MRFSVLAAAGFTTILGSVALGLPASGRDAEFGGSSGQQTQGSSYWIDYGDFDSDGDVDGVDYSFLAACFNGPNQPPGAPNCGKADYDKSGDVDLVDYAAFVARFNGPNNPPAVGYYPGPAPEGAQSPEPLSILLTGAAVGGLAWRARKSMRSRG